MRRIYILLISAAAPGMFPGWPPMGVPPVPPPAPTPGAPPTSTAPPAPSAGNVPQDASQTQVLHCALILSYMSNTVDMIQPKQPSFDPYRWTYFVHLTFWEAGMARW